MWNLKLSGEIYSVKLLQGFDHMDYYGGERSVKTSSVANPLFEVAHSRVADFRQGSSNAVVCRCWLPIFTEFGRIWISTIRTLAEYCHFSQYFRCNAHALAAGQLPHYCCHRSVQAPVAIIIITITIIITTIIITTMVTKVTITKSIPTRYLDF